MIAYLKGKILSSDSQTAVILSGGVGYEVFISGSAAAALVGKDEGELYTYLSIKEDDVSLYGFSSVEEKKLFLQLISVSGIGPKLAISVLSQMDVKKVALAIAQSDVKALTNVKGLGKKSAERIILELREKVGVTSGVSPDGSDGEASVTGYDDVVVALMSLGYSKTECSQAIDKAIRAGQKTVEEILWYCMRTM